MVCPSCNFHIFINLYSSNASNLLGLAYYADRGTEANDERAIEGGHRKAGTVGGAVSPLDKGLLAYTCSHTTTIEHKRWPIFANNIDNVDICNSVHSTAEVRATFICFAAYHINAFMHKAS